MRHSKLLAVDAGIDLVLGFLLLVMFPYMVKIFGIPGTTETFYPSLLGAVLLGIGLSLLLEYLRGPKTVVGMGLGGAVVVTLIGGIALIVWLIAGNLMLPIKGLVFLWVLAVGLIGLGIFEYVHTVRHRTPADTTT